MAQMNKKTRKHIVKQLSLDFYIKLATELQQIFPEMRWQDLYYVESTGGWESALRAVCNLPEYKWFGYEWHKASWIESDLLDDLIGTHLYNLCRKGKIIW